MPDHIPISPDAPAGKPPALLPFFFLAAVLLFLFLGLTVWLTGGRGGETEPEETQRAVLRAKNLAELRADDAKKLESYAWINRTNGSVQIPITVAMKLVVDEIKNVPPRAAYPVATPAPAATPVPDKP